MITGNIIHANNIILQK